MFIKRITYITLVGSLFLTGCDRSKKQDTPEESPMAIGMNDMETVADATKTDKDGLNTLDWKTASIVSKNTTMDVPASLQTSTMEQREVPYIDVDFPNAAQKEEKVLRVEAEVPNAATQLKIKEIWANGKQLYVISQLAGPEDHNDKKGDQKLWAVDQVTLNAPPLNIGYIIVGRNPLSPMDGAYQHAVTMGEAHRLVGENAQKIYTSTK